MSAIKKCRVVDGRRQYTVLSVVKRNGVLADNQHHINTFLSIDRSGYDACGQQMANVTHVDYHNGGDEFNSETPMEPLLRHSIWREPEPEPFTLSDSPFQK